jgi:tellurite methyltransferase
LKPEDCAAIRDWPGYYRAVRGKGPRETLLAALDAFDREGPPGHAVDLGCGEGRDTVEMLRRGWRVLAIDGHPEAFEHLRRRVGTEPRLTTRVEAFEHAALPREIDLVNASFALPFCGPAEFPSVWSRIVASLRPGGRFAGQLFGDRDSWATLPDRAHLSRSDVEGLLEVFHVEHLREEERDGNDERKKAKHWHVYHVVARKR